MSYFCVRILEFNVQHSWQLLVWLDPANYGGFKGKATSNPEGSEGQLMDLLSRLHS